VPLVSASRQYPAGPSASTAARYVGPPLIPVTLVVGGAVLSTVTLTPADVVTLPASSVARALIVWLPFPTEVEFHVIPYGAAVKSAPTSAPSARNCTLSTRRSSPASAARRAALPLTLAAASGAVTLTV